MLVWLVIIDVPEICLQTHGPWASQVSHSCAHPNLKTSLFYWARCLHNFQAYRCVVNLMKAGWGHRHDFSYFVAVSNSATKNTFHKKIVRLTVFAFLEEFVTLLHNLHELRTYTLSALLCRYLKHYIGFVINDVPAICLQTHFLWLCQVSQFSCTPLLDDIQLFAATAFRNFHVYGYATYAFNGRRLRTSPWFHFHEWIASNTTTKNTFYIWNRLCPEHLLWNSISDLDAQSTAQ